MANSALITESVLCGLKDLNEVARAKLLQAFEDLHVSPHPGDEQRVAGLEEVFAVTRDKFRIVYQQTSNEFTILGVRETAPQYLAKGYRRVRPRAGALGRATRILKRIEKIKHS